MLDKSRQNEKTSAHRKSKDWLMYCMCLVCRVSEAMPLYDILNEFQKGHSHMAVVIRHQGETEQPAGEHSTVGKFCF